MRRLAAVLSVFLLFGCGDTPSELRLDLKPSLDIAPAPIGTSRSWVYRGVVEQSSGLRFQVGDPVEGTASFEITTEDLASEPYLALHRADVAFTLRGAAEGSETYSLHFYFGDVFAKEYQDWAGRNCLDFYFATYDPVPWAKMDWQGCGAGASWGFPPEPEEFPAGSWFRLFTDQERVLITSISHDPQSREDCLGGGWEKYGFQNQGLCVRFVETGMDSR